MIETPETNTFLDIKWNNEWRIGHYEGNDKWFIIDEKIDYFYVSTEDIQEWNYFNSK